MSSSLGKFRDSNSDFLQTEPLLCYTFCGFSIERECRRMEESVAVGNDCAISSAGASNRIERRAAAASASVGTSPVLKGIGSQQPIEKHRKKQKMSSRPQTAEDKGTNVKVVVRCRPFSLSEKVREKVAINHHALIQSLPDTAAPTGFLPPH